VLLVSERPVPNTVFGSAGCTVASALSLGIFLRTFTELIFQDTKGLRTVSKDPNERNLS
jgi:hypothetical protein